MAPDKVQLRLILNVVLQVTNQTKNKIACTDFMAIYPNVIELNNSSTGASMAKNVCVYMHEAMVTTNSNEMTLQNTHAMKAVLSVQT